MDDSNDPRVLANQKKVYLQDWLDKAKSIQKVVPKVRQVLESAVWQASALADAPQEVGTQVTAYLEEDLQMLRKELPEVPKVVPTGVYLSDVTTATTSEVIYQAAWDAQSNQDFKVRDWGAKQCQAYETLQNRLERVKDVRGLLSRLKSCLATEFDEAFSAYQRLLAGTDAQHGAAIAMRNVLEHYKGELMNRARRHPREQKLSWQQMAERLVAADKIARDRFALQEQKWQALQHRLSRAAKGHVVLDDADVRNIFAEFTDHLYIVLCLVCSSDR